MRSGRFEGRVYNTIYRNSGVYYEVVKWYPNRYYGKEKDYIYDEKGKYFYHKDCPQCHIDKYLFSIKETCCTICFIEYNDHEDCWEVRNVGNRPFTDVSMEEYKDYRDVVMHMLKQLNEEENED